MAEVVGVRFKKAGKVYYFDPAGIPLVVDDYVVVETIRGLEMGQVVFAPRQVAASDVTTPLKPVLRKAEPEDVKRAREFEARETEALAECAKLIAKLNLPMKLLSAEYNLDGSRLTFYFSAAERVDFRELVRQLSSRFKVRVELRQVGPRDEAKLMGGFGRCGRPLCCAAFLKEFAPVSIKMAKEQDLSLNPMKISGCCGRLMCCLVYENEQYNAMRKNLPKNGQQVTTAMGVARVVRSNPLKETVLVELEDDVTAEIPLSEINVQPETQRKQKKENKEA